MFDLLLIPSLHENMVKIGAYVLSEFGHLITEMPDKSVEKQFELIHKHFYNVSQQARGLILTAYMKMMRTTPALKSQVLPLLNQYKDFWDEDIQQRVCEYLAMIELAETDMNASEFILEALDQMPNFSDSLQTNSILTRRIMKLKIEKGFTINKEEAESTARKEITAGDSTVSSALSQNQPSLLGINLDQINIGGGSTSQ